MLRRERDNSGPMENSSRNIGKNAYCIGALGDGRGKGNVQFLGIGGLNCRQSHAKAAGRAL